MLAPVTITASPQDQSSIWRGVELDVNATGTVPFTFQWYLNGAPISGANQSD